MTKYKVGDKVRVRKDLKLGKSYYMDNSSSNNSVASKMCEFAGKVVTIKDVYIQYTIEECGFNWTDEMFEGLATETSNTTTETKSEIKLEEINMNIKIKNYKVDENKQTIVVFFEDGDTQKAKCCDGDNFDLERGIEVCIMKHICGGADKYHKLLKVADNQIVAINKAQAEAEKRAEIKAKQRAKRAAKRKLRAEKKRAERIAEMKEAYLSALQEYNGDIEKATESVESEN